METTMAARWERTLVAAACTAALAAVAVSSPADAARTRQSSGLIVTATDLVPPRLGFVGLGANSSPTPARLMLTTDFGRTFRAIGPRTGRNSEPDSIFFLDRDHGWFATFNVLTLSERLYRTSNGGRTWRSFAAPGHNDSGGSGDSLQFLTPTNGWLVAATANAPFEDLFHTTNGAASWHHVAGLRPQGRGLGVLPEVGAIEFEADGRTGWLGGGPFSSRLYKTTDGGLTWRSMRIRTPSGSLFELPGTFGRTLVEPVTVRSVGTASLRVYTSRNDGATWSLVSTLPRAGGPSCLGSLPTSFPSPLVGWTAANLHHHVVVYRTTSEGRRWIKSVTGTPVPAEFCGPERITALGLHRAWLVTDPASVNSSETPIYATSTSGRSWRRIDIAAMAGE